MAALANSGLDTSREHRLAASVENGAGENGAALAALGQDKRPNSSLDAEDRAGERWEDTDWEDMDKAAERKAVVQDREPGCRSEVLRMAAHMVLRMAARMAARMVLRRMDRMVRGQL